MLLQYTTGQRFCQLALTSAATLGPEPGSVILPNTPISYIIGAIMLAYIGHIFERISPMLAALVTGVALAFFLLLPKPFWVIIGFAVWWLIIGLVAWLTRAGWRNIFLALAHSLTMTALLAVTEWPAARVLVIGLSVFGSFTIFTWSIMDKPGALSFMHKTWRRLIMMLWTFTTYAWTTATIGVKVFFPGIPGWLVALVVSLYAALSAFMIWSLYQPVVWRSVIARLAVLALVVAELTMVMVELPFGYLASGLLVTWVWYLAQLLMRFALMPEGIIWKNQRWFLPGNALIMALTVYFVRYI